MWVAAGLSGLPRRRCDAPQDGPIVNRITPIRSLKRNVSSTFGRVSAWATIPPPRERLLAAIASKRPAR